MRLIASVTAALLATAGGAQVFNPTAPTTSQIQAAVTSAGYAKQTDISAALAGKADAAAVSAALATKADASALAAKADQTTVTSALALKADQDATATALAAKADQVSMTTALAAKAAASSIPAICAVVPAADTLAGTIGSAAGCTPRADAARPTQVQRKAVVTGSDGSFSASWDTAWPSTPTAVFAQANTIADPYNCQVGTWTATTFSGKCWKLTASTLPALAASLPGYVVNTFTPATANIAVSVVGRQ